MTTESRIPVNIEDEMKRSYLDYAMSVIIGRALPDVRDGLKPVHRRISSSRLIGRVSLANESVGWVTVSCGCFRVGASRGSGR